MKHSLLYITAFAMLSAGFASCDDDPVQPPLVIPSTDLKANTSILDLKTEYWSSLTTPTTVAKKADGSDLIIAGRVCSMDAAGNVYKTVVIDDGTAALSFSVDTTASYKVYQYGQEVVVNMTGMEIGGYRNLMQVGKIDGNEIQRMPYSTMAAHAFPNGLPEIEKVDTSIVTIDQVMQAKKSQDGLIKWQSRLIRINDVKFLNQGEQFAPTSNTDQYVADKDGNRINLRCSSYASFAGDFVPSDFGDIVGILSYYNNDWQVLLLDRASLIGFGAPVIPEPVGPEVYAQPFKEKGQGDWKIENSATTTSEIWKYNSSYGMVANGYAGGQNLDSESWLLSPIFDLTNAQSTTFTFRHACNYFSSVDILPEQATVWAREEGGQWQKLDGVQYPSTLSWGFVSAGNIALTEFDGKKIQLGFKYVSTAAKAGTWEVDQFVMNSNGTVTVTPYEGGDTPEPEPEPSTGDGTEAKPFTVADVIAMNPQGNKDNPDKKDVWVSGYIVGWADMSTIYKVCDETARFTVPATMATNILVAATADEKDWQKCIAIQLPSGDVRSALNLVDNAGNLGKEVELFGNICKYSGVPGMRDASKFKLDGAGTPDVPTPAGKLFEETFASGKGQFTIDNVSLPAELTYIWTEDTKYHYMKASAYKGQSYASEAWLISPVFDLAAATGVTLSFDQALNKHTSLEIAQQQSTVWIKVGGGEWAKLEGITYPTTLSWTFVNSGDIDLSAYSGKKIQIGFRYTSEENSSGTWEIKNFILSGSGTVNVTAAN